LGVLPPLTEIKNESIKKKNRPDHERHGGRDGEALSQ
jgi:hypothetical protein